MCGFIFKGFPRTIVQAYILDGMLMRSFSTVNLAINLDVPMLECFKRLSNRAKTTKRRTYDTETDLIIRRMEEYETKTKPVIEYYKKLNKYTLVDGIGDENEVYDRLSVVVEKWLLDGTMLTNVSFGDLSMDDDGIADITATLRFDRAILLF